MNKEDNKKIEEILASLDGAKRVAAPDFLYTRLKAKMLARQEAMGRNSENILSRYLRPVYAIAALVLILLINATVLLKSSGTGQTNGNIDESSQTIASEYNLNESTILFDLNSEK